MASIIRIKRSSTAGNPSTLGTGEMAYSSLADNGSNGGDRLYIGVGTETNGNAPTHEVIGGKFFTQMLDHTKGELTASSAVIVDASSKVDNFKVDNLDLDGNTISSTDTNGNIKLDPNGTGTIDVSGARITLLGTPTADSDAATKAYVDDQTGSLDFSYQTDNGSSARTLNTETVYFQGVNGISTSSDSDGNNNAILIKLDATTVTAGQYGSTTLIPQITVDSEGRVTDLSTNTAKVTLNIAGDTGTDGVDTTDDTLTFTGGGRVTTAVTDNEVTITVEDATATDKGVASFNSTNFTTTSGAVASADITFGTASTVTLGGTLTAMTGMTEMGIDNININGNTISATDSDNALLILDPGATAGSNDGKVIIRGDLQVDGTQTILNSTTLSVDDLNIVLADGANVAADANGAGLTIGGSSYADTNPTLLYDATNDRFNLNKGLNLDSSTFTLSDLKIAGTGLDELIDDQVNTLLTEGEGIDLTYDDASNTLTIAAETATSSNLGVASFDATEFNVTSGAVTIAEVNGGTYS